MPLLFSGYNPPVHDDIWTGIVIVGFVLATLLIGWVGSKIGSHFTDRKDK